jgi:hypothetical protein
MASIFVAWLQSGVGNNGKEKENSNVKIFIMNIYYQRQYGIISPAFISFIENQSLIAVP